MLNAEKELQKWAPVLEHADAPAITDSYKKAVTAKLLENTEKALQEERAHSSFSLTEDAATNTASATYSDPVLISLVRRAMPQLIAYDVAGVQPMSGPTGLIFSMKARYSDTSTIEGQINTNDTEALFDDIDTAFSGGGAHGSSDDPFNASYGAGNGLQSQADGGTSETGDIAGEMGFTIEKSTVAARTRQLKAEYSMELAQDLKAIHGLDAESELANILSTEILAEINQEVIRTINNSAKIGSDGPVGADGIFDLVADADGRWAVEKFQSLAYQLEVQANKIATETRRGKGNFVICSPNVASALASTGALKFGGDGVINADAMGNTFAGTLNGRLKVYIDAYSSVDYATVGYKGSNAYDAGLYYCPYVPLTMVRAVGEATFQPKIAFKTRYGIKANPFTSLSADANTYFRKTKITNLNVGGVS